MRGRVLPWSRESSGRSGKPGVVRGAFGSKELRTIAVEFWNTSYSADIFLVILVFSYFTKLLYGIGHIINSRWRFVHMLRPLIFNPSLLSPGSLFSVLPMLKRWPTDTVPGSLIRFQQLRGRQTGTRWYSQSARDAPQPVAQLVINTCAQPCLLKMAVAKQDR